MTVDLLAASFSSDPHQEYDRIRDYSPCFYDEHTNSYIVSGYNEVSHIVNNGFYSSYYRIWEDDTDGAAPSSANPFVRVGTPLTIPDHDNVVQVIEKNIDDLLNRIKGSIRFDIVRQFSSLVSFGIFADLAGVSRTDIPRFQHWYSGFKGALLNLEQNPDLAINGEYSRTEMTKYFDRVADNGLPGDPLMRWRELGNDRDEALGMLLMMGGMHFEEAFARYMLQLTRSDDEETNSLLEDDDMAMKALEETYRQYAPKPVLAIKNHENITIGDLLIPAGSRIHLLISAANRDASARSGVDHKQVFTGYNQSLGTSASQDYQLYAARLSCLIAVMASRKILRSFSDLHFAPAENWAVTQSLIAQVARA